MLLACLIATAAQTFLVPFANQAEHQSGSGQTGGLLQIMKKGATTQKTAKGMI